MSIKAPRIKRVTGGDSYFVRNCNQDGGSIETTFKPVLVLNNVPDIQGMEEATKTRFSMVPYESRWLRPEEVDKLDFELPDDIEEQIKLKTFVMDGEFDRHIPSLANALLWIAVQYYEVYSNEGLKDPPYMQKWMEDYWKKNDCYTSFIAERLENPMISVECDKCKGHKGDSIESPSICDKCNGTKFIEEIDIQKSITATELYPEFKRWFFETYPNKKKDQLPDKKKFTSVMSNKDKLRPQHNRRWWGVVLRKVGGIDE
jgi:phage/plasmid-associated DNA primase